MRIFILFVLLINFYSAFGSYYKSGSHVVDFENVRQVVEKYDNNIINDKHRVVGEEEMKGYKWICIDSKGEECEGCKPNGDVLCKGAHGKTYPAYYGENVDSKCACVIVKRDIKPTFILHLHNGNTLHWNSLESVHTTHPQKPHDIDPSLYDCSAITTDYLMHKCFYDKNETYAVEHYDELYNITHTLLKIEEDLFKVNIDREKGKILFYYDDIDTVYTFSNKLSYKLTFSSFYSIVDYNQTAHVELSIPHESFWRNMSLDWEIHTSEHWIYGVMPIASGTIQWYANERPEDLIVVNHCTRSCGLFCFRNTDCMTDKQKNIKMAGVIVFVTTVYFILLFMYYIWHDKRKLLVKSGSTSKLSFGKKAFFCLSILSVMAPNTANAWGTCTTSAFIQSTLVEHSGGIDHHKFSGNMFLSNVNGQSCFNVKDPINGTKTIMRAILEIKKAEVIYDLQPQYTTYTSKVTPHTDVKCPVLSCPSIECGHICDNDRTCGNRLDKIDLRYPGKSACFEPGVAGYCFTSVIGCGRERFLVGYHLQPIDWYLVSKVSTKPRIDIHMKMTLDYLNGTTFERTHIIDALKPDMVGVAFKIGDVSFFNGGITETVIAPAKDYVMIHEEANDSGAYPSATGLTYLVDANPARTKVKNKVGHLQCKVETRDHCDFADDLCAFDVTRTGHEVVCGIDPVRSATNKNNKLPLSIDGDLYTISKDLSKLISSASNIGTFTLFMNGGSAFTSEVSDVVPSASLVGKSNGCFMCTTGFWFKIKAKSTVDAGQAVVSIAPRNSKETRSVGIFNKIITLGTEYQEYDIHGFTEIETNHLVVTVTAGEQSSSFNLDFKAHFDDITAIADRAEVHIEHEINEDSVVDDIADIADSIGGFFSNFFGDMWKWFKWVLLGGSILLLLSFCGPCISPLIGILISGVKNLCSCTIQNTYKAVKSKE